MMKTKLLIEYQGFLKFLACASSEILTWFGPYCKHDPIRIINMSAKEWDAMADEERRHFIKAQFLSSKAHELNGPTGKHPFLNYLLQKRYSDISNLKKPSRIRPFDAKSNVLLSLEYNEMTDNEREKYAANTLPEISIKHVLEKRDKLHKMFDPKELHILEYLIKTMPQRPANSRAWYLSLKNQSIKNPYTIISWRELDPERKRFYKDCSQLDRRRYRFEKEAWMTRLLQVDFDDENISLEEFESQKAKSNMEALNAIIDLNKDSMPTSVRANRPVSAFALFVKDYSKQDQKATSFNGKNIERIAKVWHNMSNDEKKKYKEANQLLKESYNESLQKISEAEHHFDLHAISNDLFKHSKSSDATKPSHLYSKKLPTIQDFYGNANNIPKASRQKAWKELDQTEKEVHAKKYEAHISQLIDQEQRIERKMAYILQMVEKAKELQKVKKELRLISLRKNEIKNMYPQKK